jgi:glutaredoxin-like protein
MLLTRETRREVETRFSVLKKPVTLSVFTQGMECQSCRETRSICEELAEITPKLAVDVNDFREDRNLVDKFGIERIPAIAIVGKDDFRVRLYGTPTGYVFDSLLEIIRMISIEKIALADETKAFLDSLDSRVAIKVISSSTCPNCLPAVELAARFAMYSPRIFADIVSIDDFPWLAVKYEVKELPRTVVNDCRFIDGALPEKEFVARLKKALA